MDTHSPQRERMDFDVVIVGAGPAGLSAAIRLKQLCQQNDTDLTVCVLEKSQEVGGHILSGAVLNPRALDELIPNWRELGAPVQQAVTQDVFSFLSPKHKFRLPTPLQMKNKGHYIISLGLLCRWLGEQAQSLGVDIFPGFPASDVIIENEKVVGVQTPDVGVDKQGNRTEQYQPGVNIFAKHVLIAEGARGSLARKLTDHYGLTTNNPQTYGLGIKEIWQVDNKHYLAGKVEHTIGWPLNQATYGGSFIYHMPENKLAVGFVVGLDYHNPYLSPFDEMQRFKTHPKIKPLFEGGERIAYGARALTEGGWQSIPQLTFPGGLLIGCAAGFMDVPSIKGNHTAMKSGMLAAEHVFAEYNGKLDGDFDKTVRESWVGQTLKRVRNIRPAFRYGLFPGLINAAFETYLTRGSSPWTLNNAVDYQTLRSKKNAMQIHYPKPDNQLTFDRLTSLRLTGVYHQENQPCHLVLKDPNVAIDINYEKYGSPEQYYCPAQVYEIVGDETKRLQINAANCIHCKTCDIKDPTQNIVWQPPEGGGGPNYSEM